MKRELTRWISINFLKHFLYLPTIIFKIKNWPDFLLDYLGLRNKGGKYIFRNGIVICDHEGTVTGTIAVVFIRKHYGNIDGKSVIIDIGANVGVFSIYAATEAKTAVVYAFEPVRANYELLLKNINNNNLNDRIKAFNLGVASKTGKRKIYISSSTLHSTVLDHKHQYVESIDCLSLDDILKINAIAKVDLLKMNCEGAEYEILYSTERDCFEKIFDIRLEYHNIDSDKNNVNYLKIFLEKMGFQTLKLYEYSIYDGFLWMKR